MVSGVAVAHIVVQLKRACNSIDLLMIKKATVHSGFSDRDSETGKRG